jgi:hypothetical protein
MMHGLSGSLALICSPAEMCNSVIGHGVTARVFEGAANIVVPSPNLADPKRPFDLGNHQRHCTILQKITLKHPILNDCRNSKFTIVVRDPNTLLLYFQRCVRSRHLMYSINFVPVVRDALQAR